MQAEVATPAVAVVGLSKSYGRVRALDDVSFSVQAGTVTALLGLNGAGKTTLFQILTGLFVADAGRVSVFGDDIAVAPVRALGHMGIVFQQPVFDLDLTVRQNLSFHAGLHGLKGRRAADAIADALARFRIGDLAAKRIRELSGGTRRKVELARALVTEPRLLLLDEPSQGLDTRSRADLAADVFALADERSTTVLWATHLVAEVESAGRVVVLQNGRVVADGTPHDLVTAEGAATLEAAFLGIARRDETP